MTIIADAPTIVLPCATWAITNHPRVSVSASCART